MFRLVKMVVKAGLLMLGSIIAIVIALGLSGALDEKGSATAPKNTAATPAAQPPAAPATVPVVPEATSPVADDPPVPQFRHWLVSDSSPDVVVWRDDDAMSQGIKMIGAGVSVSHEEQMLALTSCLAPSGTMVIIKDGGMFSSTVMVVSGPQDGCEGVIDNIFLKDKPPVKR